MWLYNSSIGRKVVMSLSGLFLILFLTFHAIMNLVAVFSQSGYNAFCEFMGTNPVVQLMVPVLALGFLVHIVYATILTIQNRRARGNDRYAVTGKSEVTWSAKNMYVLGIVVLGMLVWHLTHFWAKMQLPEWTGGVAEPDPFSLLVITFQQWWITLLYLLWFVAIYMHLSHGFWSALQTIGFNNTIWYKRWKTIGIIFAAVICLIFAFVAIAFYLKGNGMWDSVGHLWTLGEHSADQAVALLNL